MGQDLIFVYRNDPKRPYLSQLSRTFNCLYYLVGLAIVILFFVNMRDTCHCTSKNGGGPIAYSETMFKIFIALACYSGFMVFIFNMLFPPNATISRSTTSEHAGVAMDQYGYTHDVYKVTTTTHNNVDEAKPLRKKFTRQNICNIAVYLCLLVPFLVMAFYMHSVSNTGCIDCCQFHNQTSTECDVRNQAYLGNREAWK